MIDLGIDLGGTNIAAGLVDSSFRLMAKASVPTGLPKTPEEIGDAIRNLAAGLLEVFEQMIRIGEKDVLIGISFPRYSMRTLKAMEFANDRNARVIAVTDSIHSPMNLYSSCNLLARSDMVSIVDSLVAPLSLINALVVAMCLKRPAEVKNSLHTLEEVWNSYQVYLNDEINFIDGEIPFNNPLVKKNE